MKEEKKRKISRDTVSLEKEGKKRRAEVLRHTENEEWDNELKEYNAGHFNVRGRELPLEERVLPTPSPAK